LADVLAALLEDRRWDVDADVVNVLLVPVVWGGGCERDLDGLIGGDLDAMDAGGLWVDVVVVFIFTGGEEGASEGGGEVSSAVGSGAAAGMGATST
jgi:hypothetical protein